MIHKGRKRIFAPKPMPRHTVQFVHAHLAIIDGREFTRLDGPEFRAALQVVNQDRLDFNLKKIEIPF